MYLNKKIISGLIGIVLSESVFAANPVSPAANPGNIINTQNQILPSGQKYRRQKKVEFQTAAKPHYFKHAGDLRHKFTLKKLTLVGATVIPDKVKAIYQSKIGEQVNINDLQKLAEQLQQAYREEGYVLVQVVLPPQEISRRSGVVKLQVINGFIKNIIFVGDNPKAARAQLQRYAQQIEVEDPISYHSIDRFLILANQLPGINVSATLVPDAKVTGAADLVVKVDRRAVSAFLNANNRGTQYAGPNQGSVGVSAYDLLGADALSATGSTSLNSFDEMLYGRLDYDLVYGKYATEINPSIMQVNSDAGGNLASLNMGGDSTKYNLSVNQPLYTSTQQKLTLQSAFYHSNSRNNVFSNVLLYNDMITALTLGLDYQGLFWRFYNDVNLSLTQGMPILGAPSTLSNPSVTNAETTFTRFNLLTSDILPLPKQWSIALGSQFQYSPDILVASEQIGYGGQQFGQGFTPYIISGNSGLMGSLALRYDLPPFWKLTELQPEIFYDAAAVYYAPAGGYSHSTAQSAGLGLNFQVTKHINGNLTLAKPLTITQTAGAGMGWAGFFNLNYFT